MDVLGGVDPVTELEEPCAGWRDIAVTAAVQSRHYVWWWYNCGVPWVCGLSPTPSQLVIRTQFIYIPKALGAKLIFTIKPIKPDLDLHHYH